jgi:secreted protein with Ig-like and vWFA domain
MSDTSVGGIPKVELAKEAIIRSLGLLGPMDRAGVVAFDESAFWIVPIEEVVDPDGMSDQVGTIRASGGTDIYAGLLAVAEIIPDDPATLNTSFC